MPCVMADHDDGDVELQILYPPSYPSLKSYHIPYRHRQWEAIDTTFYFPFKIQDDICVAEEIVVQTVASVVGVATRSRFSSPQNNP